ncbi:RnfABCDGE type electron transport complex subunit D [Mucilaginibacter segetis]|uniref:RnfABCDGE type electron transport complex subunit D n=1 Tax=Mucilaginibacter segetis TaxID=2793071 RepID=A0A934PS26_9SPHI|nr:RnfABCDGE type electron transport complex subunit D [Mucilaginibacter segetis]MBK0378432.1 RnfABCDGE type electron transport complex subunit D [Mucilaginibacter segetis]
MQESKIQLPLKADTLSFWTKDYFKYVPPAFLTLILLIGQLSFGILDTYLNIIASVCTAIIAELILGRLLFGVWKNPASAYISGISVGILIRSNMVWPYVVTALISIMSKYILRYKGRHLWNPSNFGVSWMLLMAPLSVAGLSIQWGSNFLPLAVIWILGLVIVNRAKRLHVTLTYVISFVVLAYVRSLITGDTFLSEVSPLTGPMYQLFVFFMITDPPTAVSTKRGRILVAILVAVVEFFLRLDSFIYAPFYALCLVGPLSKFIDMKMQAKKQVIITQPKNA